jgi:hypothetical protein
MIIPVLATRRFLMKIGSVFKVQQRQMKGPTAVFDSGLKVR